MSNLVEICQLYLLNPNTKYQKLVVDELDNIPVFFILSRPRTGSTLLRTLFDAHPNVQIPPECQFIINLYPKYGSRGFWNKSQITEFAKDLETQFLFHTWKLDTSDLIRSLLLLEGKISYGNICKAVYWHYQSLFSKNQILLIGDKNPGYALYINLLLKIFPEARFIHLTRDYRDNFLSLARVEFELPFIALTTYKWRYFYKRISSAADAMPERFATIRYEDLVNHPKMEMERLCLFLSLPFEENVFKFYLKKDEFLKLYPEEQINKIHASLMNPLSTNKIGLWETELTNRQKTIADFVAGESAESAGYLRQFRHFSVVTRVMAFPGILLAKTIYIATYMVNHMFPYQQRQFILSELPFIAGSVYKKIFR